MDEEPVLSCQVINDGKHALNLEYVVNMFELQPKS